MLEWVFGKRKNDANPPAPARDRETDGVPPEIASIVRLVLDYWTFKPDEQAALFARGVEALPWSELFRLHHLNCLEVLESGAVRRELESDEIATPNATPADALDRCRQTGERLLGPESPYRPRHADVWQGAASPDERREPTLQGLLCNPSLTHLGGLEVLRLDGQNRPHQLAFVAFDDLRGVVMAPPNVFRAARLFFDDGRADEIVFIPLLYATSWRSSSPYYREGRMTRFLAYPPGGGPSSRFGIGLGQQDFAITEGEGQTLFGLGSVGEIAFALDARDPRLDLKCRGRGLDPDEIRRRFPGGT